MFTARANPFAAPAKDVVAFYLKNLEKILQGKSAAYAAFIDAFNRLPPDSKKQFFLDKEVVTARRSLHEQAESATGPAPTFKTMADQPKYFRTVDGIYGDMSAMKSSFGDLVSLETIGKSERKKQHEKDPKLPDGYDLKMLRLGKQPARENKPKIMFTAGMHAREIANPEILMQWARNLLQNYGKDPQATFFLDNYEILLVPMVNPDGHRVVENGFANAKDGDIWQRKNNPNAIDPKKDNYDVDLNRNFSDKRWGGPGTGGPYDQTFPGESMASESETQAIENVFKSEKNLQFYTDLHSYSQLILHPPSNDHEKVPEADYKGFVNLSNHLAQITGYTPEDAKDLYPTSGTSDTSAYFIHKIPGLTIETGTSFHMSLREFEAVQKVINPSLDFLVKSFTHWRDVAEVAPEPKWVQVDKDARKLQAVFNTANIGAVEYVLDPDHTKPGFGIAMKKYSANKYDADIDLLLQNQETATPRIIFVRAQDAQTKEWGPLTAQWLVPPTKPLKQKVTPLLRWLHAA